MKISVYITSYNQRHYLIEAIESVLAQTLSPNQIIIIDDGSTDGSQELIAGYASRYQGLITAIYHSQNRGIAQTRNDALRAVTGDFVTYVDGDDRFLPEKLEKEAKLLHDDSGTAIAFCNNYYITADGARSGVWANGVKPPSGDVFRQTFARAFPGRTLFRTELVNYQAWKKVGFYDPNLALYEDFDMRIRLTKTYRARYCDEPLSEKRNHRAGLSQAAAVEHLKSVEYIYRKNKHLLSDLDPSERHNIQCDLGEWMARLARKAAKQELAKSGSYAAKIRLAFKYRVLKFKYRRGHIE